MFPLFTHTQETLIQSWVYSFGAPFRGVILNDGILTMTSWALGWPSGNWTVRHGKSPCSISKSSNDGPFSLGTLVYVSLLEANGFVFFVWNWIAALPRKRIHPRSMKPLESCYHGDPWISFLGFEATATSTSTTFFGDFRVCFPMCSLYFFPTVRSLGFLHRYRVQSGIAWNYSPPWEVYQHLGVWRSHEAMGKGTWWEKLWVLHFRQSQKNMMVDWLYIYINKSTWLIPGFILDLPFSSSQRVQWKKCECCEKMVTSPGLIDENDGSLSLASSVALKKLRRNQQKLEFFLYVFFPNVGVRRMDRFLDPQLFLLLLTMRYYPLVT